MPWQQLGTALSKVVRQITNDKFALSATALTVE